MNQGHEWDGLLICFMHIENMNVDLCLYLLRHTCGSQRTTYTFGSFFVMCVLKIEFRSSDLNQALYLLGHLAYIQSGFLVTYFIGYFSSCCD